MDVSLFAFGFTHHRKVRRLSDSAFRLWVTAIDHANQDRSGGIVTADDLDCYPRAPRGEARDLAVTELVALKLWDVITSGSEWQIHEFEEWQTSCAPAAHQLSAIQLVQQENSAGGTPWPKPQQLGGLARAAGASRTPAGRYGPSSRVESAGPAEHQQEGGQLDRGGVACFPPDPLSDQQELEIADKEANSGSEQPEKPGSARGRARRTQLPGQWAPTVDHERRAAALGLNLASEVEKFRLHAESTGRVMANWNATFTTWLINAPAFVRRGGSRAPVQPSHGRSGFENAETIE